MISGERGPRYVLSFIAVFLLTQVTGGINGSGFFWQFTVFFAHKNFESLTQNIVVTDPLISGEVNTLFSSHYGASVSQFLADEQGTSGLIEKFKLTANIFAYDDVFRLYFYIAMLAFAVFLVKISIKLCSFYTFTKQFHVREKGCKK